jgi:two-component sensor histidine kinase
VNQPVASGSERALIVAPFGRDAQIAAAILAEAGVACTVCPDIAGLKREAESGAGTALVVEEVLIGHDYSSFAAWLDDQPPWSDFPIVLLTRRGGGIERNPSTARYTQTLGNVTFLERPFHPATLVSVVNTALRGRRRQYEARDRLDVLREAVARQDRDQARLRLLINELNHRVKNTLATVQSIVAQTLRGAEATSRNRDMLTARLLALSKAHDVLTSEQWSGADLREIAAKAAQPFRSGLGEERIRLSGPEVRLPPKTAIAVALALHELATNAVKYGALSTAEGHVEFTWTCAPRDTCRELHMVWREVGGPPVAPPTRTGFGSRLIERGLSADLNGKVELTFPPEGVVCVIDATLEHEETPTVLAGVAEDAIEAWPPTA